MCSSPPSFLSTFLRPFSSVMWFPKEKLQKHIIWNWPLLSAQFSNVRYNHIAEQQISRNFSTCRTETLYALNNKSPFPNSPFPDFQISNISFQPFFLMTSPTSTPLWPYTIDSLVIICLTVLESSLFDLKTKQASFSVVKLSLSRKTDRKLTSVLVCKTNIPAVCTSESGGPFLALGRERCDWTQPLADF